MLLERVRLLLDVFAEDGQWCSSAATPPGLPFGRPWTRRILPTFAHGQAVLERNHAIPGVWCQRPRAVQVDIQRAGLAAPAWSDR